MAFAISRRCVGALCSQSGPSLTRAGPSRVGCSPLNFSARGYAATATKQKQKVKKAASPSINAALKSASSARGSRRTATKSADSTASSPQASATAAKDLRTTSGGMSYKMPEKKEEALTEEEQMAQVEQIMAMSTLMPTADPWGQRVETLDVAIPYSTIGDRKAYPSWRAMFDQFIQNRYNGAKNATSMLMLAQSNAIPGVDLSEATRKQKYLTEWPWRIFTTTSIAKGAWMETLCKSALKAYCQLNVALAKGDEKTIKELSTSTYQDHMMRLRKKQQPHHTYLWRIHKEISHTRVISIRATEGYLAAEDPKLGNRMMVHALVRIDSEQSLEIYNRQGDPVHIRPANATELKFGNHPAERRRVTEYLVFEKRMWYDGPWVIREQLWEAPGKSAAV